MQVHRYGSIDLLPWGYIRINKTSEWMWLRIRVSWLHWTVDVFDREWGDPNA
jgi:hypothetical protein